MLTFAVMQALHGIDNGVGAFADISGVKVLEFRIEGRESLVIGSSEEIVG